MFGPPPIQAGCSKTPFRKNGGVVKLTYGSIKTKKRRAMRPHVRRAILTRLRSLRAEVVDLITDVPPAAEIVERMVTGAARLLAGASNKYRITESQ
jgi:hypothetical protein